MSRFWRICFSLEIVPMCTATAQVIGDGAAGMVADFDVVIGLLVPG
jgi:hypothetical protein